LLCNHVKRATVAPIWYLRAYPPLAALAAALVLGGCGSTIAKMPLIGEPDIAQNRPAVQPEFQPVFRPTEPGKKPMTPAERDKLQAELAAQRESAANAKREEINRSSAQ
jgi:hypothetical protein